MNHIQGSDRGEVLLLPEALDDYITPENPVRFIDAFVAQLDRSHVPPQPTYMSTCALLRADAQPSEARQPA